MKQIIYKNETGDDIIEHTWTISELQKSVRTTEDINNYYLKENAKHWKELFACKKNNENFPNEKWRNVKWHPGVQVSNRGRIKIDGKIINTYYEKDIVDDKKRPLPISINMLQDEETKNKVGYLMVKHNNKYLLVYNMVAKAWLKPEDKTKTLIHHITNDGYDNRPENLIFVSPDEHGFKYGTIHYGTKQPDPKYYPGKYDKE